jgi:hypothetical protein
MAEGAHALAAPAVPVERNRRRSRYFVALAMLLLATVAIGFGRTFFARALFDVPPIPWYLYLHASLLTSWFVLLVAQTTLIAAHRTGLHQRLGIVGAFVAAGVVVTSLITVLGLPARAKAGIFFGESPFDPTVTRFIVWTDLVSLAIFSLYVAIALYLRRRAEVHKRLLLLASIAILGPAVARIGLFLAQHTALPASVQTLIQSLFFVGLPLTLVIHDLLDERRIHGATIAGAIALLASTLAAIAIALSPLGAALVTALE